MSDDELILVEKDGVQIRVHPLSLPDHQRLGWQVVVAVAVETPPPAAPAFVAVEEAPAAPAPDAKENKPRRGKS